VICFNNSVVGFAISNSGLITPRDANSKIVSNKSESTEFHNIYDFVSGEQDRTRFTAAIGLPLRFTASKKKITRFLLFLTSNPNSPRVGAIYVRLFTLKAKLKLHNTINAKVAPTDRPEPSKNQPKSAQRCPKSLASNEQVL
jgi:hypothetical protein